MKKTLFTIALALLLLPLAGCGNQNNDTERRGTNDTGSEEVQPSNDGMNDGTGDLDDPENRKE